MSSKHTPGPWRVEAGTTLVWGECLIAEDGSIENLGIPVADACNTPRSWGRIILDDEKEANARLIAAAPELLAALKWAVAKLNCEPFEWADEDDANAHEAAIAAIAKAKGEPS